MQGSTPRAPHPTLVPVSEAIVTDRLNVRAYRADDAPAVFAAIEESRSELWPSLVEKHATVDDTRNECLQHAATWILRTTLSYGLFLRDDGSFVGGSGLHHIDWPARSFEIGYWLRTSAVGRGYVSECVRALTRLAFEDLAARRVVIKCNADNARSRRVAERVGYVLEGTLRDAHYDAQEARWHDTLVFAMTRQDWARIG